MKKLKKIIARFPKARVLVLGDLILDEYIWGKVERISPEAPVPVVWANKRTFVPGGAANVANNICAAGGRVTLCGVVGDDANAKVLLGQLKAKGIGAEAVISAAQRHTTLKTRIICGQQQMIRLDWEHTGTLDAALNRKIFGFIKKNIDSYDALIIEDYGKGVINIELIEAVISLARARKKVVSVDPKDDHFQYYRGVTSITPNRRELENAARNLKITDKENKFKLHTDKLFTDKDINLCAGQIVDYLGLESLLVTLGEEGMRLFQKGGGFTHIPTLAQEVFDVSGAGDSVVGIFTLALACGAGKLEAAQLANICAGIVVGKLGTAVVSRKELLERIK